MLFEHRVDRDGPRVRVLIADHPATWTDLDREITDALDEGVTSAVLLLPASIEAPELQRVEELVERLAIAGVAVVEEWRDGEFVGGLV